MTTVSTDLHGSWAGRDDDRAFLLELLAAPGVSSFEGRPAAVFAARARALGAEVRSDAYGSVFATFGSGGSPRVLLSGHIDEIGLIVSYIDEAGLLYVQAVGGWDSQQLVGQRVRVVGRSGDVPGVIGKKPIHLMKPDERSKASKIEDLWIDVGAKDRAEARERVRVGDFAVVDVQPLELPNGRLVSRAVDNRIGAFIALEAARRAAASGREVIASATTQEEIGGVGALAAAYALEPDVAIAIDVTHATDVPGVNKREQGDVPLGSGACLSVGSFVHRGVLERLVATAEGRGLPFTVEVAPRRTATDADQLATSRAGVPTAVVSVPNRYMHSPNEMIDLADVEAIVRLLVAFVEDLGEEGVALEVP